MINQNSNSKIEVITVFIEMKRLAVAMVIFERYARDFLPLCFPVENHKNLDSTIRTDTKTFKSIEIRVCSYVLTTLE